MRRARTRMRKKGNKTTDHQGYTETKGENPDNFNQQSMLKLNEAKVHNNAQSSKSHNTMNRLGRNTSTQF